MGVAFGCWERVVAGVDGSIMTVTAVGFDGHGFQDFVWVQEGNTGASPWSRLV
jgi:hypothetical protein